MTVYVIGGDHYDAKMGVDMLAKRGVSSVPLAITDSPSEYMIRAQDHDSLQDFVLNKIKDVPADVFLVFCNTLSFAMDWKSLSEEIEVPIISLTTVYNDFITKYKSVGVVAIHEHTLNNMRTFFDRAHGDIETIGFSMIPLIENVEKGVGNTHEVLQKLISISADLGAEAFIFGCTHFEDCVLDNSDIEVVYPGNHLIDYVIKNGHV